MPKPPEVITKLLRKYHHPLIVTDLETRTILGINDAACKLVECALPYLEGASVTEVIGTADWPAVEASLDLLASGAIEGYEAVRLFRKASGQGFTANIWVRATNLDGLRLCLVAIDVGGAEVPWPRMRDRITIAGIVTDHDWIIEMVSSDVGTILGLSPDSYKGRPLLGLLQPWDVQKLMSAVGRITSDGGGATLRVHLHNAEGNWQEVLLLVIAMCQHSPPRLGLAITSPEADVGIIPDLHQVLAARGGDAVGVADQFCSYPLKERLSTRQCEILTRLLRGERVQDIANSLYLSPSTVRNHLTVIYRKFGVHSQAELLAKLLRSPLLP
jgi:DNA-binding CsgD family transcriptional regulator/PAS domain-containing protein